MTRKLLTVFGAVFVLGIFAVGVGALLLVKDRVRIVVQADATPGPDPVALLTDDVRMLQRDLAELRTSLPASFEQFGNALDERAASRHTKVEENAQAVARLQRDLASGTDRLAERLAAILDRVAAVDRRLEAAASPAAPMAAVDSPSASEPEPVPAPAVLAEQQAAPTPEPGTDPATPEAPTTEPAKRQGFLSFTLPVARFRFDEAQDYVLLPELSRVGFDAKSTLHDFTGVTSGVAGKFTADFDDPEGAWSGEVTCAPATLTTGLEDRDANMREHLDTEHHETIRFEIQRFEPGAVDVRAETAAGTVVGRMTIRGKTRDLRMPVEVSVDGSRRVAVVGQTALRLSDYDVPVPSQLGGAITMEDEVSVWIALRARAELEKAAGNAR